MAFQGDSIFWVEVEKIVPNPFQPRREFDEEKLRELGDSIRMYGVLQPLTVTRKEVHRDDGTFFTEYELIAGERRLRASKLANVEQVPVIIRSGEQTQQEKLELAIIENLQREDLNAVDRALAFKQLADAFDLSFTQVAKKVGRSREYVSNSVRLLALPDHILESLKRAEITEGHGRTLLMLKDKPEELEVVYREILLKKLSVREVERIARKIASDKVRKKSWVNTDAHLIEMEREFTDTLGTRVQISKTDYGGKLTIDYFTESELEKLLHVIKSQRTLLENAGTDEGATETNIQELAAAESALAALTQNTPLQADDATEAANTVSTESDAEMAEETPGVDVLSEAVPSAPDAEITPPETAIPAEHTPTREPEYPRTSDAHTAHGEAVHTPTADDAPADISFENSLPTVPSEAVTEAPVSDQAEDPGEVDTRHPEKDSEPATTSAAAKDSSTTFTPTAWPARAPRVIAIFNERKTYLTDVVDVAATKSDTADTTASQMNVPDAASDPTSTTEAKEGNGSASDDEDLYSINRFSI